MHRRAYELDYIALDFAMPMSVYATPANVSSALLASLPAVRVKIRKSLETRQASLWQAAPTRDEQVQRALEAIGDCIQWLMPGDTNEREAARRRSLERSAVDAISYLVAAASDDADVTGTLDAVEREVGRFAAHGEAGNVNPLKGAAHHADVARAVREAAAGQRATDGSVEQREHLITAAAALSLVAETA